MKIEKIRTLGLISYRVGVVGLLALIAFNLSVTVNGYVDVGSVRGTVDIDGSVDVGSVSGYVDVGSVSGTVTVDGSVDVEGEVGGYPVAVRVR